MLTEDEVKDICTALVDEQQFKDRNDWIEEARSHLNRTTTPVVPGLEDLSIYFRSPKPRKDAHDYVDKLLGASFSLSIASQARPSGEESATSERRAQTMENMAYRYHARWRSGAGRPSPIAMAIFDMVALKRGHVHLFVNRDLSPLTPMLTAKDGESFTDFRERSKPLLKEFSEGERADLINCEHLPPETVYWNPARTMKLFAGQVPLGPLARQHARDGAGGYLGERGKARRISYDKAEGKIRADVETLDGALSLDVSGGNVERVMLHILYDDEYCYHYIQDGRMSSGKWTRGNEGVLVAVYPNIFGGLPIVDFNGRPTGQDHALHGSTALIEGLYETEPLRTVTGTLILGGAVMAVQQQKTLVPAPGPEAQTARQDNPSPQIHLEAWGRWVDPGWEIAAYKDVLPADVLNAFSLITEEAREQGFPPQLRGMEEQAATSGYHYAKEVDTTASLLDPSLERIADADNEMLKLVFAAHREIPLPIPVRNLHPTRKLGKVPAYVMEEITADPEDIIDSEITSRYDARSQYARTAQVETDLVLEKEGLKPRSQILSETMGVDDVERHMDQFDHDENEKFARAQGRQDAQALFLKVKPVFEGEAIEKAGLAPLLQLLSMAYPAQPQMQPQPMAMNGAAPSIPAQPDPMEPTAPMEPELGMTGAALA